MESEKKDTSQLATAISKLNIYQRHELIDELASQMKAGVTDMLKILQSYIDTHGPQGLRL